MDKEGTPVGRLCPLDGKFNSEENPWTRDDSQELLWTKRVPSLARVNLNKDVGGPVVHKKKKIFKVVHAEVTKILCGGGGGGGGGGRRWIWGCWSKLLDFEVPCKQQKTKGASEKWVVDPDWRSFTVDPIKETKDVCEGEKTGSDCEGDQRKKRQLAGGHMATRRTISGTNPGKQLRNGKTRKKCGAGSLGNPSGFSEKATSKTGLGGVPGDANPEGCFCEQEKTAGAIQRDWETRLQKENEEGKQSTNHFGRVGGVACIDGIIRWSSGWKSVERDQQVGDGVPAGQNRQQGAGCRKGKRCTRRPGETPLMVGL